MTSGMPKVRGSAAGSPMLEISNAMVHLKKEAFGRGPTRARARHATRLCSASSRPVVSAG